MAVHLAVLTVNRVVLDPDGARTGMAVALPPGGEVLVLASLALAALVVLALARLRPPWRRLSAAGADRRRGVPGVAQARS